MTQLKEKHLTLTLVDCIGKNYAKHKYQLIRHFAHQYMKNNNLIQTFCNKCGYSKHVELCHIKPIWSFPLETKICEINSKENLTYLCPNCHWELDDQTNKIYQNELKLISKKKIKPHKCLMCNNTIEVKSVKCCSEKCRKQLRQQKSKQKIQWPSIEELLDRLSKSNYTKLAIELGVSDNAIRKHIKSQNNLIPA